jgi:hypothetical protein
MGSSDSDWHLLSLRFASIHQGVVGSAASQGSVKPHSHIGQHHLRHACIEVGWWAKKKAPGEECEASLRDQEEFLDLIKIGDTICANVFQQLPNLCHCAGGIVQVGAGAKTY